MSLQLKDSGLPELLGMTVIHEGLEHGTCRMANRSTDDKTLDYILCTNNIATMIYGLQVVHDAPWWPHYGIRFALKRAAYHNHTRTITPPKRLPLIYDNKGKPQPWTATESEFQEAYDQANHQADEALQLFTIQPEQIASANRLGIADLSTTLAKLYTQWSIATETVCIKDHQRQTNSLSQPLDPKMFGRAAPPTVKKHHVGKRSSCKIIEHALWAIPEGFSFSGSDLFSVTWATIAGTFKTVAKSAPPPNTKRTAKQISRHNRMVRLLNPFFTYLATAPKSPLLPSLTKLNYEPERWILILTYANVTSPTDLITYSEEAASYSKILSRLANKSATEAFKQLVTDSLDNGDGWLHKWTKDVKNPPSYVHDTMSYSTDDPQSVVDSASKQWANQWKSGHN